MDNKEIEKEIRKCKTELKNISNIKKVVGSSSLIMGFLTKYALIKACGTIEYAFKSIISDFAQEEKEELQTYLSNKIRNNSQNPTYQNMLNTLNDFSESWKNDLKTTIDSLPDKSKILLSLESLNNARNEFAHGGDPSTTFDDVKNYFFSSCVILEKIDEIISNAKGATD